MKQRHEPAGKQSNARATANENLQSLLLMFASVALLLLAAAPVGQWYLAWVALAPWFVAVGRATTWRGLLLRSWLSGVAYFGLTLWWLWVATLPGTIALVLWFALFWALAAGLLHGLRLLQSPVANRSGWYTVYRVLGIATVWVAAEWLRCTVMLQFPWLPLGSTQTPFVLMCQVADLGGPWIVSFWLVLPSAMIAIAWLDRHERTTWRPAFATVACLLVFTALYGGWRLNSATTAPGPRVMVIQSNFPHAAGSDSVVARQRSVAFFLDALEKLLAKHDADLVVLPESEFPALNDEARREAHDPSLESTYQQLLAISRKHKTALVVGANAITNWTQQGSDRIGLEKRNCAYLFDPRASEIVSRYDKIHLVRFAERAMLPTGPEWLRRLALMVSASRASRPLKAGSLAEFRPFHLGSYSFITPICLENIDPKVVAQLVWSDDPPGKRGDFIANLSNDGWFTECEHHQHLQTTILRCIENRVPMVRSSNTGISTFIDSSGRIVERIAPNVTGFAVRQIQLDDRITFYTRFGDVFAFTCIGMVAAAVVGKAARRRVNS